MYFDRPNGFIKQKHIPIILLLGVCYFFDQMDATLYSKVAALIQQDLNLTTAQLSHLNTITLAGMGLGAIIGSYLANKLGRKASIITTVLLFSLSSLATALCNTFLPLALCRFIMMLGTAAMIVIAMTYLAEILPAEHRGNYQGYAIFMGTISLPLITGIVKIVSLHFDSAWRVTFLIGGLGLLAIPFMAKYLIESPRWLVSVGQKTKAEQILSDFYNEPITIEETIQAQMTLRQAIKELTGAKYAKRFWLITFVTLCMVIGNQYIANWKAIYLVELGNPLQSVLTAYILISFATPLGDYISAKISDRFERKTMIGLFFLIMAACSFVTGLSGSLIIFVIFSFARQVATAIMDTCWWTYTAESFTTTARSYASGLSTALSRIVITILSVSVPTVYAMYGWFGVNNVVTLAYIAAALAMLIFGHNTYKKTLEELNERR